MSELGGGAFLITVCSAQTRKPGPEATTCVDSQFVFAWELEGERKLAAKATINRTVEMNRC